MQPSKCLFNFVGAVGFPVNLSDACENAPSHHGDGVLVLVLVGMYLAAVVSVSEVSPGIACGMVESEVDDVQRFVEGGYTGVDV